MTESLRDLLRTAYMTEQLSLSALRAQMQKLGSKDMHIRIKAHVIETQWQLSLLKACMELRGIDKDVPRIEPKPDKVSLADIKRFEISLYKKMIAAAREQQAPEVLQASREILEQELTMSDWLEDNLAYIPSVASGARGASA